MAGFEFFETDGQGDTDVAMSLDFLARLIRTALATLLKALQHYAKFCEWDEQDLNHLINEANRVFPDMLPGSEGPGDS